MRAHFPQLIVAVLVATPLPLCAQQEQPAPLKVLFIGNSYTAVNDLPGMVEGLAAAAGGRKIHSDRHLVGGCTLERHVKETKAIAKIRAQKWDVVVLQEQSLRPILDRGAMHKYARVLNAEIRKQGAKTVFYLTWARQRLREMQEGAAAGTSPEYAKAMYQFSGAAKTTDFQTWCQQQEAGLEGGLNGAYFDIARELGADVAPVGVAWKMALAGDPPFVLHRSDRSHPNPTGTYLAACVFYATLLDRSPVGLPGEVRQGNKVLVTIPGDKAKQLQETAWAAVRRAGKRPDHGATYTNPVGEVPVHMKESIMQHRAPLLTLLTLALAQVGVAAEQPQPRRGRFSFEQFATRHDANQDGKVERDEFKGAPQLFRWLDEDGDGVVKEFFDRHVKKGDGGD